MLVLQEGLFDRLLFVVRRLSVLSEMLFCFIIGKVSALDLKVHSVHEMERSWRFTASHLSRLKFMFVWFGIDLLWREWMDRQEVPLSIIRCGE